MESTWQRWTIGYSLEIDLAFYQALNPFIIPYITRGRSATRSMETCQDYSIEEAK
jgi:hypothetical protein